VSDARDLLVNYQHILAELTFVTGANGVYDVAVDDELIYSKKAEGRHRNDGEILEIFEERYAQDVPAYGT